MDAVIDIGSNSVRLALDRGEPVNPKLINTTCLADGLAKTGRLSDEDAKNAYDVLCYGIAKFVGGYVAAMNGVDAIVFTAGIGENVGQLRKDVCNYFGYLGVEIDDKANDTFSEEVVISTPNSKVKVAVIPTNEELAICRETVALV